MTPKIYFEIHFSADGFIQINSNISGIRTYVGTDGKIHFVDGAGADTWSPFRSRIKKVNLGGITINADSGGTYNYDCKAYDGWENFTTDNFSIYLNYYWGYYVSNAKGQNDGGSSTSLSYNAQTGILTVTCPRHVRDKGYSCSVRATVCLFY